MPMRARSLKRSVSRMVVIVLAEDANGAGVGSNEAVGELHQDGLAAAGGAEDDAGLAAVDGEGDVLRARA